jgi:ketosteroid isomerase-like protein
VVANDEHVVGLHAVTAEREGKTLQDNNTLVCHVRDGRTSEVWQFWTDQYAADAFFG